MYINEKIILQEKSSVWEMFSKREWIPRFVHKHRWKSTQCQTHGIILWNEKLLEYCRCMDEQIL